MKKTFLRIFILSLIILMLGACNDPIFYQISIEVPIIPPRIAGSPVNFVEYKGSVYAASGSGLFGYNGSWTDLSAPSGRIISLGASAMYLYALCEDGNGRTIKRTTDLTNWNNEVINDKNLQNEKLQSFYIADTNIFICTVDNSGHYIIRWSVEGSINFSKIHSDKAALLRGVAAAATGYYLCTSSGIYTWTSGAPTLSLIGTYKTDPNEYYMGIINLSTSGADPVAVVTRNGRLYEVGAGITEKTKLDDDSNATGALAVWKKDGTDYLLLVGRGDTGYTTSSGHTFGYAEVELSAGSITGTFKQPGTGTVSSISGEANYIGTIGKNPVNHMIQASDGILFAATQKNGVWSYRVRNGLPQWNSES